MNRRLLGGLCLRFAQVLGGALCVASLSAGLVALANGLSLWADLLTHFTLILALAGVVGAGLSWLGRGRLSFLLAGLAGAALAIATLAATSGPKLTAGAAGPQIRLLTLNAWSGNPSPREAVRDIVNLSPDVVVLQEADGLRRAARELDLAFPYRLGCASLAHCRLLVLSKHPMSLVIDEAPFGPATSQASSEFAILGVDLAMADGATVRVLTTHLDWPAPPSVQARERAILADRLKRIGDDTTLLAGDFNATPWSAALRSFDAAAAPLSRRSGAWPTFPSRQLGRPLPRALAVLPIDQIYAGSKWRMSQLDRVRIAGSDHYGLFATLHQNGTQRAVKR